MTDELKPRKLVAKFNTIFQRWEIQDPRNAAFSIEVDVQAAIDAALESLKTSCNKCEYDESDGSLVDHCAECQRKIVTSLYAARGTNPLADLQQKNLELARHNMELRDRVMELERELADLQVQRSQELAELREEADKWHSEVEVSRVRIAELERELAEARKDAFSAGYEKAHDDTVEGLYSPEQSCDDYIAAMRQEGE